MNEFKRFPCIFYETLRFAPNQPLKDCYRLFVPNATGDGTTITEEHESEMIRLMFRDKDFRNLLLSELELLGEYQVLLEVGTPVARHGLIPGDFDVILYNQATPPYSIGIECKAVSVKSNKEGNEDKVTKLGKIRRGVQQANGLRKDHNFHLSYLLVFAKVDAVAHKETNVFFSSASLQALHSVYDKVMNEPLHDDVGIVIVEIVQPTRKNFSEMGMVGVHVERLAKPCEQSEQLTNRITEAAMKEAIK